MKQYIQSAELKYYNANNRGTHTGDCVKRAMSLAFDMSYSDMGKLLNDKMHEKHRSAWNEMSVFTALIEDLGGGKETKFSELATLGDFVDNYAKPGKVYLILTGKKYGQRTHLVCVKDGKVWDSWDSLDQMVTSYWELDGSRFRPVKDTSKATLALIADKYASPIVAAEISRYAKSKGMKTELELVSALARNSYQIKVTCKVNLAPTELIDKMRTYNFNIMLVIEPTWDEEEIVEFVKKMSKQRTYDRMWAINEQEKKLKEAAEIRQQLQDPPKDVLERFYLSPTESKFIKSLPGWARPLVTFISINSPGQYHDSYTLKIRKLPNDTLHPGEKSFMLEDYDADGIREQLNIYKDTMKIDGIDYYKDW